MQLQQRVAFLHCHFAFLLLLAWCASRCQAAAPHHCQSWPTRSALRRRTSTVNPNLAMMDGIPPTLPSLPSLSSTRCIHYPLANTRQLPFQTVSQNAVHRVNRGGDMSTHMSRPMFFWENMLIGTLSKVVANTIMHPATTLKTLLQSTPHETSHAHGRVYSLLRPANFRRLTHGAGANFFMSVPQGFINFTTTKFVRSRVARLFRAIPALKRWGESNRLGFDFLSSATSNVCCSVVTTP